MSDRSSARAFSDVFQLLAEDPSEDHKAMAKKVWLLTRCYDFSDCQLECDDELVKLGLARRGVDPRYPQDGETIIYEPHGGTQR